MKRTLWILLAILVLAAVLRFYRLDAQSFWNDEGTSARVAERSLPLITAAAVADIHPPLYYYVLHFWRDLWGESEFALRGLSSVLGILLVSLIYLLGHQLFDESTALIAAFIAALNPFQVYYSQEARMYVMLAIWAAASTYFLMLGLNDSFNHQDTETHSLKNRPSSCPCAFVVGYTLTTAAGMYTHYAFPFVLVVHNLAAIAWLVAQRKEWRKWVMWIGLQAAVVALYVPWLGIALLRIPEWQSPAPAYQLGPALLDTLRWFAFGRTIPTASATIALGAAGLFLLASLLPTYNMQHATRDTQYAIRPTLLLLSWWLIPIILIFALGLYKEAYLKFLLVCSPAFCLLFARGVVTAWRTTSNTALPAPPLRMLVTLLLALMAALTLQSLSNLYFDPAYARDNYRGIAQRIEQDTRPGDAILLEAPNQWEVFTYYHRDDSNVIPLARARPVTEQAAVEELSQITARFKRLLVLYWAETEPDPNRHIERWLNANAYKASESWFGAVRLAVYAVPTAMSNQPDHALDVRLGDAIQLRGYSLAGDTAAPGDILQLALFWQAQAPITTRYKVFVHILDGSNRIVAQVDREPGGELVPTTIWPPGQAIVDRYGVLIPPDAAPGRYRIAVGLYGFDGVRLTVRSMSGGDQVVLTEVSVAR